MKRGESPFLLQVVMKIGHEAVNASVTDGFLQMITADRLFTGQIGHRARHFQDPLPRPY